MDCIQEFGFSSICMSCTQIASPSATGLGSTDTILTSDSLLPESVKMLSCGLLTSCQFPHPHNPPQCYLQTEVRGFNELLSPYLPL